jgi:hypothetical protein
MVNPPIATRRWGHPANAFEAGLPSAYVIRLTTASHYVFRSDEADVMREMNVFLARLPSPKTPLRSDAALFRQPFEDLLSSQGRKATADPLRG